MKKEIHICEQCHKRTDDYLDEKGWIHIDGFGLGILNGRNKDGESRVFFWSDRIKTQGDEIDFCSLKCLISFLKSKIKSRN